MKVVAAGRKLEIEAGRPEELAEASAKNESGRHPPQARAQTSVEKSAGRPNKKLHLLLALCKYKDWACHYTHKHDQLQIETRKIEQGA